MALMRTKGNLRTNPVWLKENDVADYILPIPGRVDWTQFGDDSGVPVVVDTAGAVQGATTVPVVALTSPEVTVQPLVAAGQILIYAGSVISFGPAGSGKFAKLTADAKYGDVSIAVEALPTALVALDRAVVTQFVGTEYILSGRTVGRTFAERASSTPFGPLNPASDDEGFLIVFDIPNARLNPDCELLKHGAVVAENYLPDYDLMAADTGLVDPTVAPTLSHTGTDGPASAGVKSVGYTFLNAFGESKLSPLATVTTLTTEHIGIADIAFPTGVTGIRFYASPAPGDNRVQFVKELNAHAATSLLADGAGPTPPAKNTTKNPVLGGLLEWIRTHYQTTTGVD